MVPALKGGINNDYRSKISDDGRRKNCSGRSGSAHRQRRKNQKTRDEGNAFK